MNFYVVPALVALVAKLMMLVFAHRAHNTSRVFMVMVLIFALHNVCEVLLFLGFFNGTKADFLLKMYYSVSIASLFIINCYVASLVELRDSLLIKLLVPICLVFIVVVATTDLIVTGSAYLSYIITATRGEFYWVFQLLSIGLIASIFIQLYVTYSKTDSYLTEIRSVYTTIALVPLLLTFLSVIFLMNLGFNINGTLIFPFATTLFLLVTLASEYQHKLTDIRRFLPFSDERRTSNEIMEIFSNYARDESDYRDSVCKIERLLVIYKLSKADGNATLTAEQMGMPRSSLYSIFNRLKIKVKD